MAGKVQFEKNGPIAIGRLEDGGIFVVDSDAVDMISGRPFHLCYQANLPYIIDDNGRRLESYLMNCPDGCAVSHISNDTLDNRRDNLQVLRRP